MHGSKFLGQGIIFGLCHIRFLMYLIYNPTRDSFDKRSNTSILIMAWDNNTKRLVVSNPLFCDAHFAGYPNVKLNPPRSSTIDGIV
jgi:hypothetical protein